MKKIVFSLILVFVLFAFVGCASKGYVSGSGDAWWDNLPVDTKDFHYEVGVGKDVTLQLSRDLAKTNAYESLVQYVNNSVERIVMNYTNSAGELSKNDKQALTAYESISKQHAVAALSGVQWVYHTAEDGTCFVLAQLPIGIVAEELKSTVQEAFAKNAAAEEANKMMNEAIDKYFGV